MSQKSTRRSRRLTNDDEPIFKAPTPTPKPNGTDGSQSESKETTPTPQPEPPIEKPEIIETQPIEVSPPPPEEKNITNGHEQEELETPKEEMEVLIASDEPEPELVFEENSSDRESGHESPVLGRCKTRRSLTRNIPTPKTPKLPNEEDDLIEEPEVEEEPKEELNVSFESCSENTSMKVEVCGDSTRLNYTESNLDSNSFLQEVKNKSFGETLKRLSSRRTIRPISYDYRKRLLQTNLERNDLGVEYPSRNSIERVVGVKRKNSGDEEDGFSKRLKSDSPGFFSKFTSPLANLRNTFRSDITSSTPKLTGYKDEKFLLEEDGSKMYEVKDGERRWCSIM